jgi:hypothetical protein
LPAAEPAIFANMNFDIRNRNGLPVSSGWRRKGEWRWQRPS